MIPHHPSGGNPAVRAVRSGFPEDTEKFRNTQTGWKTDFCAWPGNTRDRD